MSTIGGPGGIGGPKGPSGPDGASELADSAQVSGQPATGDAPVGRAHTAGPAGRAEGGTEAGIEALAAEVAAGRLTPHEATDHLIDRLVDATAGPELDPTERAELRELLTDLVAHDPHLGGLVGRI
ncbi:MAG TPA: hypothetical protein VH165_05760 [Kofleriaceae bacterium]|jgi:hypothetical protein|nr:hypothetical protein [Kofleriaceae bacterium]